MDFIKDFARATVVGIIIFLLIVTLQILNGIGFNSPAEIFMMFFYTMIYSLVLFFINVYYFRFLLKTFSDGVFKAKNIFKGAVGAILITLVALFFIRFFIEILIEGKNIYGFFLNEKIENYLLPFLISVMVTAVFYTIYYYRNKQEAKVVEHKIKAGKASAQFDALKSQLDPHFLFNSLNVLTGLIEENPQAATQYTTTLSRVYRYVLEHKNKNLVSIKEEIDFAKLYMTLLSVRFSDSIDFRAPEELKNPEARVAPLSLQLLLENAVKHNQLTPAKKLKISIEETDDYLVVGNNLQEKTSLKGSTGFGLKNIKERFKHWTDLPVEVRKTPTEFRVSLPLIGESARMISASDQFILDKRLKLAQKKVDEIKAFYIHFAIYICAVPFFIYLNYISQTTFFWALFPIAGWGLGVAGHAADTFDFNPFFGKKWEEKKIRKLMEKEN